MFGSKEAASRKSRKEKQEIEDRSATENVMTEISAQRKLNKSRDWQIKFREPSKGDPGMPGHMWLGFSCISGSMWRIVFENDNFL